MAGRNAVVAAPPRQEESDPPVVADAAVDPTVRARLHTLAEQLDVLERQVHETQLLVRQLAAHLRLPVAPGAGETDRAIERAADPSMVPAARSGADLSQNTQICLLCLGPFEVLLGREAFPQRRTGKGRAILKFLAARPRQPVPRDVLLDALWPEVEPQIANNRLKVAMHHLRQICAPLEARLGGGELVVFRDGCYAFNPRLPIWTNVEAFQAAWQQGVRCEQDGQVEPAIACYRRAELLYRGDFFEEDVLEDWTLVRREELKDTYLTILGKLSRYWLQVGSLESAIEVGKKILVSDPWREDVYRHLMICFARAGRRALALHWYDLCTQVLQKQLQLAPEPETVELYRRIRDGKPIDDLAET